MVAITIQADKGITHKVWEKEGNAFNDDPGVLRYYFYGPGGNPSKRNELGCFDLKGRYAGKFKANDGAKTNLNVVNDEKEAVITLIAPSGDKVYIGKVRGPMTTQDRITLGMCINNATAVIAASRGEPISLSRTWFKRFTTLLMLCTLNTKSDTTFETNLWSVGMP